LIAVAALVAAVVAIFGAGVSRLALLDVEHLETEQAAEQSALAAAGVASFALERGAEPGEVDALARREADTIAHANVARGTVETVEVTRTSDSRNAVVLNLTLTTRYGGFAGVTTYLSSATALVRR
jgi:hypothetical protein